MRLQGEKHFQVQGSIKALVLHHLPPYLYNQFCQKKPKPFIGFGFQPSLRLIIPQIFLQEHAGILRARHRLLLNIRNAPTGIALPDVPRLFRRVRWALAYCWDWRLRRTQFTIFEMKEDRSGWFAFVATVLQGEEEDDLSIVLSVPGSVVQYNVKNKTSKKLRGLPRG
ncbi:unnamed protein product, partial [Prunus brigantina]